MIRSILNSIKYKRGLLSTLLLPLSWIYTLLFLVKYYLSSPKKVDANVICVGNVIIGGGGKTPVVQFLVKKHKSVAIILRGYGGKLSGFKPIRVDPKVHTALDVGDEALMHSKMAPTYICKDRYLAAKAAVDDGAKVIIMDDGFQNFSLVKDRSILVFDSEFGVGNGRVLPSGFLREPLSFALKRANELYLLSYDGVFNKPFDANFKKFLVDVLNKKSVKNKRFVSFCALANPAKFYKSLEAAGAEIVKKCEYADHHIFSEHDIAQVISVAKKLKCKIITTSKDIVKIDKKYHKDFVVLEIGLKTL